jgi:HPt (histidine-containing phosphotransfer) domain-containing protein
MAKVLAAVDDAASPELRAATLTQWPARIVEAAQPPVDPTTITGLALGVGPLSFAGLLDTMIRDATRLLDGLQQALEESDTARLRHWAHTLKSNAMMVGAAALVRQFEELESVAGESSIAAAASKVESAQVAYRELMRVVGKLADDAREANG